MENEILDEPEFENTSTKIPAYLRLVAFARSLLLLPVGFVTIIFFYELLTEGFLFFENSLRRNFHELMKLLQLFVLLYFSPQLVREFILKSNCYEKRHLRVFALIGTSYLGFGCVDTLFLSPQYIQFLPDSIMFVLLILIMIVLIQDIIYLHHNLKRS